VPPWPSLDGVEEELGDLLWYVANVASKFDLTLNDIATRNLRKVQERWGASTEARLQYDEDFPESERLPRRLEVEIAEIVVDSCPKVSVSASGMLLGSPLGDNAYDADGYRFHDVFHLTYAAILGWSPNLRAFLKRKRKSNPLTDEVEDGGRARVLEEAVSALVFDYARMHNFLIGVTDIDYALLHTVRSMTAHLEVGRCTVGDWQRAILEGFDVWRQVLRAKGGRILIDLDGRRIAYLGSIDNTELASSIDLQPPIISFAQRDRTRYCDSGIVAQTNNPTPHT
jgi:MazG C-terminal domain/MazG nucleotide pyrophosphohydrolase domain